MSSSLYSGVSGLAIGTGLYKGAAGLWGNSSGLISGWGSFSPASLFLAGEQGFIYDPSDFTTLYQDASGTTPVTAVGQTVGLVLDKSRGLVLGPELVTNGDFSDGTTTGWSASGSSLSGTGGVFTITTTAAANGRAGYSFATVAGRTYRCDFKVVGGGTAGAAWMVRDGATVGGGTAIFPLTNYSAGTYSVFFVAISTTTHLEPYAVTSTLGATAIFDNISVRELPGNHATQSVLASRPILAREPLGGRRNLLTWTEQFDNAVWTKSSATITANAATAPDGTLTADKLEATGIAPSVYQDATVTGTSAVLSAYMKKGSGADKANVLLLRNQSLGTNLVAVRVNLDSGAITYLAGSSGATATDAGNGWWRVVVTASITSGNIVRAGLLGGYSAVSGDFSYFWGAQLETGSTATAYQRVTSTYDVTEAGKADLHYLLCDGSDDFLVTNTITPGTDKAQVFAGLRKLSDAGQAAVLSLGNITQSGGLEMFAPTGAGGANFNFSANGGVTFVQATATGYAAPVTAVATGTVNFALATGEVVTRINGSVGATSTGDAGTANLRSDALYIGRRGGTSLPFNGRIYSLIVRFGPNLSDVQIAQTEAWVNSRTGAY